MKGCFVMHPLPMGLNIIKQGWAYFSVGWWPIPQPCDQGAEPGIHLKVLEWEALSKKWEHYSQWWTKSLEINIVYNSK